jgi:hypothetical protein
MMGIGSAANTHSMYKTIHHEHMDGLVYWARGEFPDAGLNLVECADGRWFVEVDHGTDFDGVDGVSKPNVAPFVQPRFFIAEIDAREFAYSCIKMVYPDLKDKDLSEYYSDDDDE